MSKNWKKSTHEVILEGYYSLNGEPKFDFHFWEKSVVDYSFQVNTFSSGDDQLLLGRLNWVTEPWGTPNYSKVLRWRNTIENKCQEVFFKTKYNADELRRLYVGNVFQDGVLDSDVWWNFIVSVTCHHFDTFKRADFSLKDKVLVLKKVVSEKIQLILELKRSKIYRELSNNEPDLPQIEIYMDELQFKDDSNVKSRSKRLYLGVLGNPFIYPPCYPLKGYSAVVRVKDTGGVIHVGHPQDFLNLLSERVYFYTFLLKETSILYLDYLCNSALEVVTDPN